MTIPELVAFLEWLRSRYVLCVMEPRDGYGTQLKVESITNEALAAQYRKEK